MQTPALLISKEAEERAFLKIDRIVNKTYLQNLQNSELIPFDQSLVPNMNIEESVCLFPIKNITFDKKENNFEKLASVYTGAAAAEINPVLMIRGYASGFTELYLGVCGEESRMNGAYPKCKIMQEGLIGQFPGFRTEECGILPNDNLRRTINSCFDPDFRAVAAVSCVASSQETNTVSSSIQGLEKIIETMNGKEYTFIVLAQHIPLTVLNEMRSELEFLYTQLSPLSKMSISAGIQKGNSVTKSISDTISSGINRSSSVTLGVGTSSSHVSNVGIGKSWSNGANWEVFGMGTSYGEGDNISYGESDVTDKNRQESNTKQQGWQNNRAFTQAESDMNSESSSLSMQYTVENKKILRMLSVIESQLKRLQMGSGVGMFAVSAYCLSPSLLEARIGACSYKAVISGDTTNLETNAINVWTGKEYKEILKYLRQLRHPEFELNKQTEEYAATIVTGATFVTAAELAVHMPFPQKSIHGVSVRESVTFGRNIHSMNPEWESQRKIPLGQIYHLGRVEQSKVLLSKKNLTMHTFVTGTTGSGKSNALYGLLTQIQKEDSNVHFLVIEPAKGEYKEIFAEREDVDVYGTNQLKTPVLKINPFSFPDEIHILEHLDKLMAILLVCWPMYAAMPSVLKSAIIDAYKDAGWDMKKSRNKYGLKIYPTFTEVMDKVKENVNASDYSSKTKGDYVGSLCTRLEEMTEGLNEMIFVSDAISDEMLFDRNVIIDLSRVDFAETKALIMGMLVMKLQEYRQSTHKKVGSDLKHVLVLEEAHHLLKKAEGDTAGIVAQSVQMLTSVIAELRSFGEGVIIADQAPNLLDRAVIRNTNTKIILHLQEHLDRELVGKAVGLTENQINEIAMLPTGVAVVHQNGWMEAVLSKIPYYKVSENGYQCPYMEDSTSEYDIYESLLDAIMTFRMEQWMDNHKQLLLEHIDKINLTSKVKCRLYDYMNAHENEKRDCLMELACSFFDVQGAFDKAGIVSHNHFDIWCSKMAKYLKINDVKYSAFQRSKILMLLLRRQAYLDEAVLPLYLNYCSWIQKEFFNK